ncbi:periplasmic nitrate reductase, NapE protein [Roseobacter sp. EG26]|uniref:periplasmic nitrate reductase, NapE protein n=1 Tax=Roseobacter sp. EG26 TaxID=3412477 RepID=UPI002638582E|nr:periplasmic nitrate reductase, NapE protein [uncultured Roseobacter sp.]
MTQDSETVPTEAYVASKAEERRTFVFLAVFLAPILSVVLVGGYGFTIWMSQLLLGPPSH